MTFQVPTERVFSLACFEGLRLIRKYSTSFPELPIVELLPIIDSLESDARSLDMEASVYLSKIVDTECPIDGHAFYQTCIKSVLLKHRPIWAKLMRQGRKRFVNQLEEDDQDIFEAAGLLAEPTPLHVVVWWDSISGFARLFSDEEKMGQGRAAELLTLQFERERLKKIGVQKEPEWPGFDDNFAGYDVLSFDIGASGLTNRLIEVKSTTLSPMQFIVTRNEWTKASQAADAYIFHIWDMSKNPPVLHTRTVAEIAPHIPVDQGSGAWSNARVPVKNDYS